MAPGGDEAGWMGLDHAPPPQQQARWMSLDHTSPTQQLGQHQQQIAEQQQVEDHSPASHNSALPDIPMLRGPKPALGEDIEATTSTGNEELQHGPNINCNIDDDIDGKMYPPEAGQSTQGINSRTCNSRNSPKTSPAAPQDQWG